MQQIVQEILEQHGSFDPVLETCVGRISAELKDLAQQGDWEVIKSVFRVIDAHTRASELRAQGQPARAHLWLVNVGRKRPKTKKTRLSPPSPPSAA